MQNEKRVLFCMMDHRMLMASLTLVMLSIRCVKSIVINMEILISFYLLYFWLKVQSCH